MRIAGDIQLDGLNIVFDQASGTATTLLAGAPAGNITLNLPITADTLVGRATSDTLTNKTINASNNTVSNLTVAMLAAGVLNTSTTLTGATDSQVPSALAAKTYTDNVASTGLALKADKTITLTAGTGLTGGGDLSANRTFNIANTAVTLGSYGSATAVGTFTVDQQGRLTAAADVAIQIAQSQVTGLVTDLSNKASSSITITAGTGLSGGGDLTANRTLRYS
jgi:trimeric autotransporter adhesin